MTMKWYVIQAYSGYENRVRESLLERFKQGGLERHLGEILIPKESVQENRGGKKRVSSRNFYPGYVFVQLEMTENVSWSCVCL